MFFQAFLKGASLAFYIVVPIGALSILYIKRTLENGVKSGIVSSLGVTTVEAIYAAAAIYGIGIVSDFLLKWKIYLQLVGVVFMMYVGLKAIFTRPQIGQIKVSRNNLWRDYFSMLLLTLFNPLTLFGFIAVFTSFGAHEFGDEISHQLAMLSGFVAMSFGYCMLLIFISSLIKNKFRSTATDTSGEYDMIAMLHKISGIAIILFTLFSFFISLVKN